MKSVVHIKEINTPSRRENLLLRILIAGGIFSVILFCVLLFSKKHAGFLPLHILLCVTLVYKFIKLFFEWYHYWSINVPLKPALTRLWKVDMLTTSVKGEPVDMIKNTLTRMKQVRYPHTTYLCDDGNDPLLKEFCKTMDIVYVTRADKTDAKAGNINHALQTATGEICVILDPDHQPAPEFLDEILPYFEDPHIGFVQIVQAYKNVRESLIAKGAAQQTYTFYGPMMMCMNSYGTVQAIGANCTFRREALDSIGGHSTGLAEDMHTAMQLYAAGWKSVYVPKILTRGLVPASQSAYYKQQFKWSSGTFELLLHVYPRFFKRFTLRQKLHYFFMPLHYAVGLITLIDILIPAISLFSGYTPLLVELNMLAMTLIPLMLFIILIRQYAQRWLVEKYEYGFHITGGILLFSAWWVYVSGLLFTVFRIKVPYIATPKAEEHKNSLRLSLPNLAVCCISLFAVIYGLRKDWSPYSFMMAGFCCVNVLMLGIVIFAGQLHMIWTFRQTITKLKLLRRLLRGLRQFKIAFSEVVFGSLRAGGPVILMLITVVYLLLPAKDYLNQTALKLRYPADRYAGGFYTGVFMPAVQKDHTLLPAEAFANQAGSRLQIISLYESWGPDDLNPFPMDLLNQIAGRGAIPMITWEPWVGSFPENKFRPLLRKEIKGMKAISDGLLDEYIRNYALKIRAYHLPVFIRFAQEPDNPAYPWSRTGGNTPEDYIAAWQKIVSVFASQGAGNVSWVYNPWDPGTMKTYYPGDQCVDWIGLTCLNYGDASKGKKWLSFEQIYDPYKKDLLQMHKQVMLAEFASTNYGGDGVAWIKNSLSAIQDHHPEIKSIIFFNSDQDKNWITSWRPNPSSTTIDWTLKNPALIAKDLKSISGNGIPWIMKSDSFGTAMTIDYLSNRRKNTAIYGRPGSFTLVMTGTPFYVKGIAYDSGQPGQDANYPLTRRQLEKDFEAIRNAGANTIRRYQPSVYDKNILTIAGEYGLKVIYGFSYDPSVDYYNDSLRVKKYIEQTIKTVSKYKSYSSLLGWSAGNETSSLLKKYFDPPYLNVVRQGYIKMIESIAKKIHDTDPGRPVLTCLENTRQLPYELDVFHHLAPSVDIIGINSFYEKQISLLRELTYYYDSTRPYLVSEFGAEGCWDKELSKFDRYNVVVEENDWYKASQYSREWKDDVMKNKGYNIGGVAYTWRDRFECSATWSGITDYKERKKPAYSALQNAWKNQGEIIPITKMFIIGPDFRIKPGIYYTYKVIYDDTSFTKIEWRMYSSDYTDEIGVKKSNDNRLAFIRIPDKEQSYRLYVYVSDNKGHVVTASKSVLVYKPEKFTK